MLALHVAVHVFHQQVAIEFLPAVEKLLCRRNVQLREVAAPCPGRHFADFGVERLHVAEHVVLPLVRDLADVRRDHVIPHVGEIGRAVEEPERRRGRIFEHRAVALAEALGNLLCRAEDRRQARGGRVVHAEPEDAHVVCHARPGLRHEPESGLLGGRGALVDVLHAVDLELHRAPAVGTVVASGADVGGHVHRSSFVVVAHAVEDRFGRHLRAGLHPQRHAVVLVVAHRVVGVSVHVVGHGAEEGPHAGFAGAHGAEVERRIGVAEAEIGVRAVVVTHLTGERDHVRGVEAVLGIVLREGGDAGLVGVGRDIAVGNAARHPDDAFAGVPALFVELAALADQLHDPRLVRVGDRERLAARRIAVGVGQLGDHADGLAGGPGPLQRNVYQRSVVHAARRVLQFGTASVGRFADDERMLVHVADGRPGLFDLRDVRQVTARVPFVDGQHRPGLVLAAGGVVQRAVERVGVRRIGDHHRTVGRSSSGDDEIGAGRRRAVCAYGCRCKNQSEFFHCFSGFDTKDSKKSDRCKTELHAVGQKKVGQVQTEARPARQNLPIY